MRRSALCLALKLPAPVLLALPPLALTHLFGMFTFPALVVLFAGSRRLATVSRSLHGIGRPYPLRPRLEPAEPGWYWTGYDYHRGRPLATVSLWFNWVGRDPATWRDLVWLALDPLVGTVLLLLGRLRWHTRWTRALLAPRGRPAVRSPGPVDRHAAELERIERDLHDGAQARLVALQLALGLARRALREDPDGADELLLQARATAADAVVELRDLVRGIRPPVLTERGLAAALRLLALDHPLAVTVTGDLAGRLAAPVETAVYFATAELLTNVTKHARARTAEIRLGHTGGAVRVAVIDDGVGGADPAAGSGLDGVRRRLRPLAGTLALDSPAGAPTTATLEVPCVLSSPKTYTC